MIKQIRLSLLTAVLSLFLAGFAFAQEDSIKPFGGIEWEDGLLEEQREEQRGQIYLSIASKSLEALEAKGTDLFKQCFEIFGSYNFCIME